SGARFGCGTGLNLHPVLNTRTRYLTAVTRDLRMGCCNEGSTRCCPYPKTASQPFTMPADPPGEIAGNKKGRLARATLRLSPAVPML
ncbi:MAG: hypothetical protein RLZ85_644, partial [Verrucomicrobiota bacterium]